MPFLSISTLTNIPVYTEGAQQETSIEIGETTRAFDGTLRVARRSRKRVWAFVVGPVSNTYENNLRTLDDGLAKTCSGDMFNNISASCFVNVQESEYMSDGGTGSLRLVTVRLEEA